MKKYYKYPVYILLFLLSVACNNADNNTNDNIISESVFGERNAYAELFRINEHKGYKSIDVRNPWQGAENILFSYVLATDPEDLPAKPESGDIFIRTPVERIVCVSTTHIAMLDTLGCNECVTGVSGSKYVYNTSVRKRISEGEVKDIGYEGAYNFELIVSLKPDVVLIYGIGNESASDFRKLSELGIPVVFIADYLELHPLGKAEWIKVFGLLLNKEDKANMIFDSVRKEYEQIHNMVKDIREEKKSVLLGLPFKDKWFVSPGNSYISQLISDAGGNYLWDEIKSNVSVPMSLEAVFQKALNTDIWLNSGSASSIKDIISIDSRLAELSPLKQKMVFNNNKRLNEYGGNDYWESGTINPHILLKDIASILYPDYFPDYNMKYYKKIK